MPSNLSQDIIWWKLKQKVEKDIFLLLSGSTSGEERGWGPWRQRVPQHRRKRKPWSWGLGSPLLRHPESWCLFSGAPGRSRGRRTGPQHGGTQQLSFPKLLNVRSAEIRLSSLGQHRSSSKAPRVSAFRARPTLPPPHWGPGFPLRITGNSFKQPTRSCKWSTSVRVYAEEPSLSGSTQSSVAPSGVNNFNYHFKKHNTYHVNEARQPQIMKRGSWIEFLLVDRMSNTSRCRNNFSEAI